MIKRIVFLIALSVFMLPIMAFAAYPEIGTTFYFEATGIDGRNLDFKINGATKIAGENFYRLVVPNIAVANPFLATGSVYLYPNDSVSIKVTNDVALEYTRDTSKSTGASVSGANDTWKSITLNPILTTGGEVAMSYNPIAPKPVDNTSFNLIITGLAETTSGMPVPPSTKNLTLTLTVTPKGEEFLNTSIISTAGVLSPDVGVVITPPAPLKIEKMKDNLSTIDFNLHVGDKLRLGFHDNCDGTTNNALNWKNSDIELDMSPGKTSDFLTVVIPNPNPDGIMDIFFKKSMETRDESFQKITARLKSKALPVANNTTGWITFNVKPKVTVNDINFQKTSFNLDYENKKQIGSFNIIDPSGIADNVTVNNVTFGDYSEELYNLSWSPSPSDPNTTNIIVSADKIDRQLVKEVVGITVNAIYNTPDGVTGREISFTGNLTVNIPAPKTSSSFELRPRTTEIVPYAKPVYINGNTEILVQWNDMTTNKPVPANKMKVTATIPDGKKAFLNTPIITPLINEYKLTLTGKEAGIGEIYLTAEHEDKVSFAEGKLFVQVLDPNPPVSYAGTLIPSSITVARTENTEASCIWTYIDQNGVRQSATGLIMSVFPTTSPIANCEVLPNYGIRVTGNQLGNLPIEISVISNDNISVGRMTATIEVVEPMPEREIITPGNIIDVMNKLGGNNGFLKGALVEKDNKVYINPNEIGDIKSTVIETNYQKIDRDSLIPLPIFVLENVPSNETAWTSFSIAKALEASTLTNKNILVPIKINEWLEPIGFNSYQKLPSDFISGNIREGDWAIDWTKNAEVLYVAIRDRVGGSDMVPSDYDISLLSTVIVDPMLLGEPVDEPRPPTPSSNSGGCNTGTYSIASLLLLTVVKKRK